MAGSDSELLTFSEAFKQIIPSGAVNLDLVHTQMLREEWNKTTQCLVLNNRTYSDCIDEQVLPRDEAISFFEINFRRIGEKQQEMMREEMEQSKSKIRLLKEIIRGLEIAKIVQ